MNTIEPTYPIKPIKWLPFRLRKTLTPYLFIAPILVLASLFYLIPILRAFDLSLKRWLITTGRKPEYIGLDNYSELISDQYFIGSFFHTVHFVLGVVPIGICISLGLALLLNLPIRFRAAYRAVFFIPVIIPTVVVAMVWSFLFAPYGGVINEVLKFIGFQTTDLLSHPDTAMNGIIVTSLWKAVGFNMVIFLAGLQTIPGEYYEAAMIDGANGIARFWHITLPLLMPTMLFAIVIATIGSFQVFTQVFVMTSGGPAFSTTTLVHFIYLNAFEYFRIGYASASAIVLFFVILILSIIQMWILRSGRKGW